MSRNDQLLVKEYEGKFYVFDVMAESWDAVNELSTSEAEGVFGTREEAHSFAHKLGSEYGVVDEVLYKDGAPITITQKGTQ